MKTFTATRDEAEGNLSAAPTLYPGPGPSERAGLGFPVPNLRRSHQVRKALLGRGARTHAGAGGLGNGIVSRDGPTFGLWNLPPSCRHPRDFLQSPRPSYIPPP